MAKKGKGSGQAKAIAAKARRHVDKRRDKRTDFSPSGTPRVALIGTAVSMR